MEQGEIGEGGGLERLRGDDQANVSVPKTQSTRLLPSMYQMFTLNEPDFYLQYVRLLPSMHQTCSFNVRDFHSYALFLNPRPNKPHTHQSPVCPETPPSNPTLRQSSLLLRRDQGLGGYHASKRYSRDTFPESILPSILVNEDWR